MDKLKFTGLGACQEVGRSSFLIDFGPKIILDRGLKITSDGAEAPLPVKTNIDAAIISHAHLDHSGDLPSLFNEGAPITFLTSETLEIAELLWHDTLKIAKFEGKPANYTKQEIEKAKKFAFPIEYKKRLRASKDFDIEFLQAGHILGSALTKLYFKNKTLLYTGDFKVKDSKLLPDADLGKETVDYVIIESTYGDREHAPRKEEEKKFIKSVKRTIESNGIALLPSFAVGRSEELAELLYENNLDFPIYFDGMGQKAAKISLNHPDKLRDPKKHKMSLKRVKWIKSQKDRINALKKPCAIITTAGMLAGGPAMFYLERIAKDSNSSILFTGYQVEGTPGRHLIEHGTIQLPEKEIPSSLTVEKFDFSGHASQDEMLYALKKWSPEKIVLVHGDEEVIPVFKEKIESVLGIDTIVPVAGKTIEIDTL